MKADVPEIYRGFVDDGSKAVAAAPALRELTAAAFTEYEREHVAYLAVNANVGNGRLAIATYEAVSADVRQAIAMRGGHMLYFLPEMILDELRGHARAPGERDKAKQELTALRCTRSGDAEEVLRKLGFLVAACGIAPRSDEAWRAFAATFAAVGDFVVVKAAEWLAAGRAVDEVWPDFAGIIRMRDVGSTTTTTAPGHVNAILATQQTGAARTRAAGVCWGCGAAGHGYAACRSAGKEAYRDQHFPAKGRGRGRRRTRRQDGDVRDGRRQRRPRRLSSQAAGERACPPPMLRRECAGSSWWPQRGAIACQRS